MSHLKTDEFYKRRRDTIGASEVPAIMGVSPYRDAYEVWLSKRYPAEINGEMTGPQEWGHRLEEAVARKWGETLHDHTVMMNPGDFPTPHKRLPWFTATIDAIALHLQKTHSSEFWLEYTRLSDPIEIKTFARWRDDEEPGEIRIYDLVQVQAQLECTGRPFSYLAYLVGGSQYHEFEVPYDEAFCRQKMLPAVERFKQQMDGRLPPPEPTHLARAYLSKVTATIPDEIKLAVDFEMIDEDIQRLKQNTKENEKEIARLEALILAAMGEHEIAFTPTGTRYKRTRVKAAHVEFDKPEHIRLYRKEGQS